MGILTVAMENKSKHENSEIQRIGNQSERQSKKGSWK